MQKHNLNIFPDMSAEEFERLKVDIQTNGFDSTYPIMLYDNQVLDGWNRYRACEELKKTPLFDHFAGNDEEALALVMRSNKRRNLSDDRLAALAIQSNDMMEAIQKQVEEGRREKLHGNDNARKGKTTTLNSDSSISIDKNENTTDAKIAEAIGVKRNVVAKIKKLKKEDPEGFEQVAKGTSDTRKLNKAKKNAKLLTESAPILSIIEDTSIAKPSVTIENEENTTAEYIDTTMELSDIEILEFVMLAKIEVRELAVKIIAEEIDNKSLQINQQHFKAIENIQMELGQVLTGYKI